MRFALLLFVIFACSTLPTGRVSAETFPSRPLTLVVANGPGSTPDLVARVLSPELAKTLGQPVIVENRPGANGIIGWEYVAKQRPADGYTMVLVLETSLAILPATTKALRFDPVMDLPPVIGLVEGRFIFASSSTLPWKSLDDMVRAAKASPDKFTYCVTNVLVRLQTEMLLQGTGARVLNVQYREAGGLMQALVTGESSMGFLAESQADALGDKVTVLATTGATRSPSYPNAPTFAELGFPNMQGIKYSMNVARNTPASVVKVLHEASSRVLGQPAVREALEKLRFEIVEAPADVVAQRLQLDSRRYAEIARNAGIVPQ